MGRAQSAFNHNRNATGNHLSLRTRSGIKSIVLSTLSLIICGVLFTASSTSEASALSKGPSLSQLESYISHSAAISQAPNLNGTIPPLENDVSDGLTLTMKHPCYGVDSSKLPSNPQSQCLWGDKKGKKSIFLFGDSQAATWLPAMNQIGLSKGYKIYFLSEASCPPWEPPGKKDFQLTTGLTFDQCIKIVSNEIQFAITIHPTFIVLAGDGNDIGPNQFNPSTTSYAQEMATVISRLKPSRSEIVLLSQVPQYNVSPSNPMTPVECLTVHGNDIIPCLLNPEVSTGSPVNQAFVLTSTRFKVPLINILPLFCTSQRCPLIVWSPIGVYLTHYDQYHMDKFYSVFIAHALSQLLIEKVKL
jgi:hypothetical protein